MKKTFFLEIPSNPKFIGKVEDFLQNVISDLNLSDDLIHSLLISVTEAVNNAMIHGNKKDPEKKVKINCFLDDTLIEVHIKDEGNGFKVEDIPDPLLPENLTKDSGRGIFIIKSLLSSFEVKNLSDGTEVILKINLPNSENK